MILREKGINDFSAPDPGFIDSRSGDYGYEVIAKAVVSVLFQEKRTRTGISSSTLRHL
ncbi:hypothetical protein MKY34_14515 [Sporosarcina sp. FSL K6-1522]|uniref:hypothetical protein n=1 Tax=Sporosarcina sp. FSL K6-1522 TaxID=2921554 RepID=UPI00315B2CE7